ncbi:MAG TPA: 3-oxoacyl-ACP reductase FabG [Gammaproteobacteria bacterium]|nr:3-oxoacyl-ACP reductase FabG [Gammaproteobacteria bacterium]HIK68755.1 3-oxoacyl-ACP reductase FabG [Pseudomonadales bacterium]
MLAVVTGASRGIGKAIALRLIESGHEVIGTATTQTGAESISRLLGAGGQGFVLNISTQQAISEFLDELKREQRVPQILVNNAGITKDNIALRMKPEEWQSVIDTNLSSVFHLSRGLLRGMTKARWGRIVNISSVVGSMGNPGQINYAAAKAGMEGFCRALAAEIASRNITVNAVAPGFIDTDMTRSLNESQQAKLLERVPAGRLGSPEEVAGLVDYLVSEQAAYINGETIHINGGLYMG